MLIQFKRIVDLAIPLKSLGTAVYPGSPEPLRANLTTIEKDGGLSYLWVIAEHTGTHVDAPAHMVNGGTTIDQVPLEHFAGPGIVLDFSNRPKRYQITREDIEKQLESTRSRGDLGKNWILLFYCGYTAKRDSEVWLDSPDLTEDACKFIISLGASAIGIDAFGPDHAPWSAHHALLPNNVVIFENLCNLEELLGKDFIFVGTPIPLVGGSGAFTHPIAFVS